MKNKNYNCSITANTSANDAIKRIKKIPDWWGVTFSGSCAKQNDKFMSRPAVPAVINIQLFERYGCPAKALQHLENKFPKTTN